MKKMLIVSSGFVNEIKSGGRSEKRLKKENKMMDSENEKEREDGRFTEEEEHKKRGEMRKKEITERANERIRGSGNGQEFMHGILTCQQQKVYLNEQSTNNQRTTNWFYSSNNKLSQSADSAARAHLVG